MQKAAQDVSEKMSSIFGTSNAAKRSTSEKGVAAEMPPNPFDTQQSSWISFAVQESVRAGLHSSLSAFGTVVVKKIADVESKADAAQSRCEANA